MLGRIQQEKATNPSNCGRNHDLRSDLLEPIRHSQRLRFHLLYLIGFLGCQTGIIPFEH